MQTPEEAGRNGAAKPRVLEGLVAAVCGHYPEQIAPVARLLEELGCAIRQAESPEQLDRLLDAERIDVIFAHICPSRPRLMALLGRTDLPPVIVLLADKDLYIETISRGAFDCLPLRPDWSELVRVTRLAIKPRGKERQAQAVPA
ncbi:MAG TPA: hypothetical protein VGS20_09235 [Candidatus Acidoferrales bacterium]|nr:hypothetical protein [Candidatus Acidoferrales bacterium]